MLKGDMERDAYIIRVTCTLYIKAYNGGIFYDVNSIVVQSATK